MNRAVSTTENLKNNVEREKQATERYVCPTERYVCPTCYVCYVQSFTPWKESYDQPR